MIKIQAYWIYSFFNLAIIELIFTKKDILQELLHEI